MCECECAVSSRYFPFPIKHSLYVCVRCTYVCVFVRRPNDAKKFPYHCNVRLVITQVKSVCLNDSLASCFSLFLAVRYNMGESLYENPALQELRRRYNKHKRNYIIKIKEKNKFYRRILRRFFSFEICVCVCEQWCKYYAKKCFAVLCREYYQSLYIVQCTPTNIHNTFSL